MGLGSFSPNAALWGNIRWDFHMQSQWVNVASLWYRAHKLLDNRLLKRIFYWSLAERSVNNWVLKCIKFFELNDMDFV